jgi:hypothetical protein
LLIVEVCDGKSCESGSDYGFEIVKFGQKADDLKGMNNLYSYHFVADERKQKHNKS